jgi:hypothetical protein
MKYNANNEFDDANILILGIDITIIRSCSQYNNTYIIHIRICFISVLIT